MKRDILVPLLCVSKAVEASLAEEDGDSLSEGVEVVFEEMIISERTAKSEAGLLAIVEDTAMAMNGCEIGDGV
jgi:hypothetical protein